MTALKCSASGGVFTDSIRLMLFVALVSHGIGVAQGRSGFSIAQTMAPHTEPHSGHQQEEDRMTSCFFRSRSPGPALHQSGPSSWERSSPRS